MVLLVGPPGAGKSTFCQQTAIQGLMMERPTILVTTDYGPGDAEAALREQGLREVEPGLLSYVNAYHETVGLSASDRPDTVLADSGNLSSIGIALSRLQDRVGGKGILLIFDSLTSPYLLSGQEIVRFLRITLSRFVGEGNSVLACFDEGSGREEDLVAMMSIAEGVIKIEMREDRRLMSIVKHPTMKPTRVEVPITPPMGLDARIFDPALLKDFVLAQMSGEETASRGEVGDYVNLFWPCFARWSGMLWDPKRFPRMAYDLNRDDYPSMFRLSRTDKEVYDAIFPWRLRLMLRLMPKNLSKVKDIKKLIERRSQTLMPERVGIMEYLEEASRTDEHYIRVHENFDCWGLENMGTTMAFHLPPFIAGMCMAIEGMKGLEREWNAVETKCIGLGDPYCEFKLIPGEPDGLKDSLEKDGSVLRGIHDHMMSHLMGFLLEGKPLVERPRLGSDIHIHPVWHTMALPAQAGERFRTALRMGGAKSGKEVGKRLTEAGLMEDEAARRVIGLLRHCKVGKVSMGETIRMKESCESYWSKFWATPEIREPSCYFTTGFLNGFFSAVKDHHVKETRCIAMGDPYCEWEFR